MRWLPAVLLVSVLSSPVSAQQLAPPGTGGIAAVDQALSRLNQNKRVLMIAAHPDDEDTELLTLLSRGMGVDAAYLSLSRGEGGQNLIGPELGEALGLIRTGELLAARSADGARQYFTRAFDFGFSKTLDETLRFWPRDSVLADVLGVIRRFKPQVIVTIFSGTPRDGHGQHQMSAVIAREAFELLRDSAWGPRKLYRNMRFDPTGTGTTRLASGMLDPVSGRTITQIAMAGRSQHRSQDMGTIQRFGGSTLQLQLQQRADGRPVGPEQGLFDGVDTSLAPPLARYGTLIDSARAMLGVRSMDRIVPLLTQALHELRSHGDSHFRLAHEEDLQEAIATAAGIVVDAVADDATAVPGQPLNVTVSIWNGGSLPVRVQSADFTTPGRWSIRANGDSTSAGGVLQRRFIVTPPANAESSAPYFLRRPRVGALYDWSAAGDLRGEPLDPALLRVVVEADVGDTRIHVTREVSWQFRDQAYGEVRKPVVIVPAVSISILPEYLMWSSTNGDTRSLTVELAHGARGTTSGEVTLDLPQGWPAVPPQRFSLEGEGTRQSLTFTVRAPARVRPGVYEIGAEARTASGRYDVATQTIDYPHIRPMVSTAPATMRVAAAPLELPRLRMVGYVRGASDRVPEALQSVGVPVTLLDAEALGHADFGGFDVIVIGSRAYETEPALAASNARLMEWVRGGGRLIVQYQQYQFVQGNFAPFRMTIGRPHDRVTDEDSPVTPLLPGHPLFATPNAIVPADWAGWVQERGLYFAREWDQAYRPLIEMGDANERLRGGILVARAGSGLYVYTGVSFFRQLPAAVPGAFKLFLNLLGLEPGSVP